MANDSRGFDHSSRRDHRKPTSHRNTALTGARLRHTFKDAYKIQTASLYIRVITSFRSATTCGQSSALLCRIHSRKLMFRQSTRPELSRCFPSPKLLQRSERYYERVRPRSRAFRRLWALDYRIPALLSRQLFMRRRIGGKPVGIRRNTTQPARVRGGLGKVGQKFAPLARSPMVRDCSRA